MDSSNGDHSEEIALIRRAVSISIEKHDYRIIAVVGHYDCPGNAVTRNITICKYGWRCVKCPHGTCMHRSLDFIVNDKREIEKVK